MEIRMKKKSSDCLNLARDLDFHSSSYISDDDRSEHQRTTTNSTDPDQTHHTDSTMHQLHYQNETVQSLQDELYEDEESKKPKAV